MAVALALDEDQPDVPTTPLRTRSRRRRQKIRIRHRCDTWHRAKHAYDAVLVRCLIHDTVCVELGEWGRVYPAPVCWDCLEEKHPHLEICPMQNPAVLLSWINGGNSMTCVCPARLKILGLAVQKMPKQKGQTRAVYGVGPIAVQTQAAEAVGVSQQTVSNIRSTNSGKRNKPDPRPVVNSVRNAGWKLSSD